MVCIGIAVTRTIANRLTRPPPPIPPRARSIAIVLVRSCARALVRSCARALVRSCARALVRSQKRQRRTTPVKARAAKAGIVLPPTPAGIRDDIQADSPRTRSQGKKDLQRHQQACQQVVDRAERKQGNDEARHERLQAKHRDDARRSYEKTGRDVYKKNRETAKARLL